MIKVLIAVLLLAAVSSAELPAIGDNVKLSYDDVVYIGQIIDLDDTWICLNCSYIQNPRTNEKRNLDGDICFGIGSVLLGWQ